jgi:hypothetical protein
VTAAAGSLPAWAAESSNLAGPMGLVLIVLLGVALAFLARSMIRHLNRVPRSFDETDGTSDRGGHRPPNRDEDGDGRA